MKIVVISDTHDLHKELNNYPDEYLQGDILIHAGDFSHQGESNIMRSVNDMFGKLDFDKVICISGNHDVSLENDLKLGKRIFTNAEYLYNEEYVYKGIKFYGSPYQPAFGHNWAFNLPRKSQQMRDNWNKIPEDTDVLITHGPPHGILDECPDYYDRSKNVHVGCEILRERVCTIKPKMHVFGHIHESYGKIEIDGTTFVNASIWNHSNGSINRPIILNWG